MAIIEEIPCDSTLPSDPLPTSPLPQEPTSALETPTSRDVETPPTAAPENLPGQKYNLLTKPTNASELNGRGDAEFATDGIGSYPRMTAKSLKKVCKQNKHYITPYLNDNLYLHMKGWWKIENLEPYTGLTSLWLQGNGLQTIEGLDENKKLIVLYLHENLITKIENISHLTNLRVLNLEQNMISKIEGLKELRQLETLNLAKNRLTDAESIMELTEMSEKLTTIDLAHNQFKPQNAAEADQVIQVFMQIKDLRVVNMMGNQLIRKVRNYRKTLTIKLKALTYLDDRPVFPRDRACAEAWAVGGPEAEREERQRWINKDRKKIQDAVDHLLEIRENANRRRRELGLEPIGGDVDVETASESGSDVSSLVSDVESEKSGKSDQSKGSSHVSMIKREGQKPVSKDIFADDDIMRQNELDDDTSDAYTGATSTRNQTDVSSYGGSTRDQFSEVDSDVHSEKSFSLDTLPSCHDDVSSITSSRHDGRRILIESDDEDESQSGIFSVDTDHEENGLPSLISELGISDAKDEPVSKPLIEELD